MARLKAVWNKMNMPLDALTSSPESVLLGFGFGGAKLAEIQTLVEMGHPGDVAVFGIDAELQRHFGEGNPGAASFVRRNTVGMLPWTNALPIEVHDIGLIRTDSFQNVFEGVKQVHATLHQSGLRPAMVACDHTASLLGLIGALEADPEDFVYLYFDAHFDLGYHADLGGEVELNNGNFVDTILGFDRVTRVINIGGRSWSTFAPVYKDVPGFTHLELPASRRVEALIECLSDLRGSRVYVSVDADVLDPSCIPNTPCPEPFGLQTSELLAICQWIGDACEVVGADLCEILPAEKTAQSEQALMRCLLELFRGGQT